MKTVYYAHAMSLYGTKQELRDILTLESLGFKVANPNSTHAHLACGELREAGLADSIMDRVFRPMVTGCSALAFRAFPDGSISAGVAKEIEYATQEKLPIIELPSSVLRRSLTIGETRETLAELGQR